MGNSRPGRRGGRRDAAELAGEDACGTGQWASAAAAGLPGRNPVGVVDLGTVFPGWLVPRNPGLEAATPLGFRI